MDGDRSPSTNPAKLVLHHQPINNQKDTADFIKPLAKMEQRVAVGAPEEKLAMKHWRRLFREQADELDAVRYGGVKHFIAGIPEPPATDESDDNIDLPVAADVDGFVTQVMGTDQLTNLSTGAYGKLVIQFEEVTAGSMGKRKAEDDSREIEVIADPKGKQSMLVQLNVNSEKQSKAQNHWTKPPEGWAKLNFDAGFNEQSNSGSWGAVLRNNKGDVIFSAWGKINHCKNVEIAEATAGLLALQSVIPNYSGPILVENDCATLVSEVKMVGKSKSAIANTVDEIKNLLRLFPDFAFSKVHRSCNEVAHVLARVGRSELGGQVLIGSVPSCVMEFSERDCIQNNVN
ncbi:hypothetical protein ACQ4PT_038844 [Festuca glaucescens]